MKEIVKLVVEWDAYESEHENVTVEDFCRYYIIREKEKAKNEGLIGWHIPPDISTTLAKLLSHITAVFIYYFKRALKNEEKHIDIYSFALLNSIYHRKESKKTDAINENLLETSTGIDILKRLEKKGYITERDDPDDKRVKLVKLTPKGEEILFMCWKLLRKISFFMYQDLDEDEKKILIQLLYNIDIKHVRIISENKGKDIDEIIDNNSDRKKYEEYKKLLGEH